jgi:MFS family permease
MNGYLQTLRQIPTSVWVIGLSNFLLNISSVIVFGICALYMKYSLGATLGLIAILEGTVEASANLTKLFSGVISDYLCRRKILMVLGFSLATVARPILALFPSVGAVIVARVLDRIGNGIQSAPRDALVGDLAPEHIKGACFGLRQAFAQAGSCVGGIVSYWLLTHSNNDYTFSFWIATIPVILGLIILIIFVKEPESITLKMEKEAQKTHRAHHPIRFSDVKRLGIEFWALMILVGVFYFARLSENFLLIHANTNFGFTEAQTQLILMFYNGSNALMSYPVGMVSDRMPRMYVLALGVLLLIVSDIILATASSSMLMLLGVSLWGIQIGITQSMFLALIVDKIPHDLRGTGIGVFYLLMSLSLLLCGFGVKALLKHFSLHVVFMASGCIGILSIILVFFIARYFQKRHHLT